MSRFGRSRVQDRAVDSDDIPVVDDQSRANAAVHGSNGNADATAPHIAPPPTGTSFVTAPQPAEARDLENDRAIDALRAATTAAGGHAPQPTTSDITRIHDLHATTADAERRARRVLSMPSASKKFQQALTTETEALRALGFSTYEAFATAHGTTPAIHVSESDMTIARIRQLLTELGVDPLGDPLRAASDFLTAHEADLVGIDSADAPATDTATPSDAFHPDPRRPASLETEPSHLDWTQPISPKVVEIEHMAGLEHATAAGDTTPETLDEETTTADTEADGESEPSIVIEPPVEIAPVVAVIDTQDPWVPAAQIPTAAVPPEAVPAAAQGAASPEREPDDDVVDRWIHAEARAERMHAEVDQAQAELVAMLARSAELEQTVVTRVDELDLTNEELERVRNRVGELERSIAKSGAERVEIERALTASRDRVAEVEASLLEREQARATAERDRITALETVAELETILANRTSELVQARNKVGELETELMTQSAQIDQTRGEIGTLRADREELTTELETTRRALDALDAHAEAIEAELADARRNADHPETRRELDAVHQELEEARHELGHLALQRAETDRALAHDRIELQQLQHTLAATRDEALEALDELTDMRRTVEETMAQVEAAELARDAVPIDVADLLARAEAEATSLLERANRDAEMIRQDAILERGAFVDGGPAADIGRFGGDTLRDLADQVDRLERKLTKQRRRLDRSSRTGRATAKSKPTKTKVPDASAVSPAEVVAAAEREAAEIRRAARRDRERFREELVTLLSRLAPDEDDDLDDLDDDYE